MTSSRRSSLAHHLLCAVPQLQDPNFRRSVVLMLEHSSEGALGLVINNPLPNTVAEVTEGLGLTWLGDPDATIRLGGPVEPMRGWILHDDPEWDPEAHDLVPGLKLTTSLEPVTEVGNHACGSHDTNFLFLLGYAGWGSAQLEAEIAAGSWVAVPIVAQAGVPDFGVSPTWLFEADPSEMWDEALRAIGVDPGRLVGLKGGVAELH